MATTPIEIKNPPKPVSKSLLEAEHRAIAYLKQHQYRQAIEVGNTILQQDPNSGIAYKLLGNAYQGLGNIEAASRCYRRAIERQPNYAEAYANLGNIEVARENPKAAIEWFQKAIAVDPKLAGGYRNLARLWQQLGNRSAALDCLSEAIGLDPTSLSLETHQTAARELFELGEWTKAIVCFGQLPLREPKLARAAYGKMSEAFRALGKLEEAQACLKALPNPEVDGSDERTQSHSTIDSEVEARPNSISVEGVRGEGSNFDATAALAKLEILDELPQLYCDRREWTRAIAACRALLQKQPSAGVYKCLGTALWALGDRDRAVEAYREALRLQPRFPEVLVNLGSIHTQQEQFQAAIGYYQQALQIDPQLAGAYRNLAKLWEKVGDELRALTCWSRALAIDPVRMTAAEQVVLGNRWSKLGMGRTDAGTGGRGDAQGMNARGSREHCLEEAERCYRRAINFEPTLAEAWYSLGEASGDRELPNEAVLAYQRAIALDARRVEFYEGLAKTLVALERWQAAESAYRRAIELAPESDELHHRLGDVRGKLGQPEAAVEAYCRAIVLDRDRFWSYNNLGDALMQLERWQEAAAAYRRATGLKSDWVWAFYNLGDALAKCEAWSEAVDAYGRAMALKSDLPEIEWKLARAYRGRARADLDAAALWSARALAANPDRVESCEGLLAVYPQELENYFQLGEALVEGDRISEAVGLYRDLSATELNAPSAAAVQVALGKALVRGGDREGAKAAYQRAIDLDPDCEWAHHHLAEVLTEGGQLEAAIDAYDRAIETHRQPSFWSYYNRGMAQVERGDIDGAMASFRQAIELDPNYSWTHKHLGDLLATRGDIDGASACYQRAIQGQPEIY